MKWLTPLIALSLVGCLSLTFVSNSPGTDVIKSHSVGHSLGFGLNNRSLGGEEDNDNWDKIGAEK